MGHFNRGGDNKRFESRDNRGGGFGRDGGRPSFQKKSWGGEQSSGNRDFKPQMFPATCSECGKACEVPFRPNGSKPVFCSDCFGGREQAPRQEGRDRFPRKEFNDRPTRSTYDQKAPAVSGGDELKKQLEVMNVKLDRLIRGIEALTETKSAVALSREAKPFVQSQPVVSAPVVIAKKITEEKIEKKNHVKVLPAPVKKVKAVAKKVATKKGGKK